MKIVVHDYAGHPFQVELSRALARRGHEVIHVFASALQTPRGDLGMRETDPGGFRVRAVEMEPAYPEFKYSFARRRRMEIDYGRRVAALIRAERPAVVLSSNTPTETQEKVLRAARSIDARFIFWLQDFYSLAVGKLARRKLPLLGRLAGVWYRWLERRQFHSSDGIVAITGDFLPMIQGQFGVPGRKVSVVPNWAPIESLPVLPKVNEWSTAHGLTDKFVFLYTGTLGLKHNPGRLLELAQAWRHDDRVRVVVISEGLGAEWLRERAAAGNFPNIIQMGYQPFAVMPGVLAAGDVLVGVLEEDAGVFSVPSKILAYLCAQRPILLAAPSVNLASRTVAGEAAGVVVDANDREGFLAAAVSLRQTPALALPMAQRGRAYAERAFRIAEIARRFEQILTGKRVVIQHAPQAAADDEAPAPACATHPVPAALSAAQQGLSLTR